MVVADDEVVQRKLGGPHLKRTWWTEESIGTASGQGPEDLSAKCRQQQFRGTILNVS